MTSAYQTVSLTSPPCSQLVSENETAGQVAIDLWAAGYPVEQIANRMGITANYVRRVVNCASAPKDRATATERASQQLLDALRRYHPDRCGQ